MSVEKEATVRARLEGVDEVSRGFQKIGSSASDAGSTVEKGFKSAGGAIKDAVNGVVSDIGHVVTAAGAISFAGAIQGVHQFEESVARLGVGSGRSIQSVKDGVNELSAKINELPGSTAAWIASVGKLTYGYEGAARAAQQASEYAALTGQSANEVMPLVVTLEQLTGASGQSGHAMEVLAAQADKLSTVGGPKALGDMIQHLQGQLSGLSDSVEKSTALLAGFGGNKGYTPQQRERALSSWMSRIESNPEGFERFLGHKITDEYGHVKNMPGVLKELQDYGKRGAGQRMRLQFTTNAEAMQALMHTSFGAIEDAEHASASAAGSHALDRLKDTPAGQRRAAEVQKAITMQDTVGAGSFLGDISDWMGQMAGGHPVLTGIGTAVGTKLLGKGVGWGLGQLFGEGAGAAAAGGGGAAASGGGATALGLGLGGVGLAAVGTLAAGVIATGKTLVDLGAASADKQGFTSKAIGYKDAEALAAAAKSAESGAAAHRSSGMQAAYEAEKARIEREHAGRTPTAAQQLAAAPGGEAQFKNTVDALVKAGADLKLAQETAAKMLLSGQAPIQIEVVNATGGEIDARPRGQQ